MQNININNIPNYQPFHDYPSILNTGTFIVFNLPVNEVCISFEAHQLFIYFISITHKICRMLDNLEIATV